MNWRRPKMVTIAPAEKKTWQTLTTEETLDLVRWFNQPPARIYLALLASEQDNAISRSLRAAMSGKSLDAAVDAAKADACMDFARFQAKAMTLKEEDAEKEST